MKTLLLVVDDDIDDIELIQESLNQIPNAPDIKYFLSAEELLKFLVEKRSTVLPPLAITLDINLPGLNGIALLSLLKKDYALNHIPISMVTTSKSLEQKDQCMKNGASHFFTKPVEMSDWVKILSSIVENINLKK